ncbi:hypothetical protein [Shewanella xiamenensis]|uniref:Uncharacterized protein n=1 Tax=Shewanella xiamenensis TaxID=332186 RepID=A0ABT6UDM4_9GAMM|nr:hypothetical protein [Shewanella xiamenensis]MDI5832569.1 hypothetical protein [Shewanella xiamenensis]
MQTISKKSTNRTAPAMLASDKKSKKPSINDFSGAGGTTTPTPE